MEVRELGLGRRDILLDLVANGSKQLCPGQRARNRFVDDDDENFNTYCATALPSIIVAGIWVMKRENCNVLGL